MRGLAAMKMSLCQHFRLLLDYRDIWMHPNERTMACALMLTNYCVVVLPSKKKSSELSGWRLVTMNAVYLWRYFPDGKYGSVDYKQYHLINWLKKNGCQERFNRFKDQNTCRDSLYHYTSVSLRVEAHFNYMRDSCSCPYLVILCPLWMCW